VAFLEGGRLERHIPLGDLPRPLYRLVERWLREAAR